MSQNERFKKLIIEVINDSKFPIRPNHLVVSVCERDRTIKMSEAVIIRDLIDGMMVRGELVYNESWAGLIVPKKVQDE